MPSTHRGEDFGATATQCLAQRQSRRQRQQRRMRRRQPHRLEVRPAAVSAIDQGHRHGTKPCIRRQQRRRAAAARPGQGIGEMPGEDARAASSRAPATPTAIPSRNNWRAAGSSRSSSGARPHATIRSQTRAVTLVSAPVMPPPIRHHVRQDAAIADPFCLATRIDAGEQVHRFGQSGCTVQPRPGPSHRAPAPRRYRECRDVPSRSGRGCDATCQAETGAAARPSRPGCER